MPPNIGGHNMRSIDVSESGTNSGLHDERVPVVLRFVYISHARIVYRVESRRPRQRARATALAICSLVCA